MTFNFNNVTQAFGLNDTPLSYIYGSGDYLLWPPQSTPPTPPDPSDYETQYTTFEFLESGTFGWTAYNGDIYETFDNDIYKTIYYSLNNNSWIALDSSTSPTVNVNSGDKVRIKGNNLFYGDRSKYIYYNPISGYYTSGYKTRYNKFTSTARYNIYGNIMSLMYGDSFQNNSSITYDYAFFALFADNNKLVNASNLVLPTLTLNNYCYEAMFLDCTSLISAPKELPATTLGVNCYARMFAHCSQLINAQTILPAMTLKESCYGSMFSLCTSLVTAPKLPATTLVYECYIGMFSSCEMLNNIECYATDLSAYRCLFGWVERVSPTGTFTKKSSVTWPSGDSGIPTGWTVVNAS